MSPVAARAQLAPPGDSSAAALQVGQLVAVSTTGAHAAPDAGTAQASVLQLGGSPVSGLGGTQKGDGEGHGALFATGSNDQAEIQLAPWAASVKSTPGTRHSKARAALARAKLAKVADLAVLESESEAVYQSQRSTGSGYSNGINLGLLDAIHVILLHSEVSSEGKGSSYLVGLNDTKIGTNEQLGKTCALEVNPVLSLSCLKASGGVGNAAPVQSATADVATASSAALTPINPVGAFVVAGASGLGATDLAPAPAPVPPVQGVAAARALPAATAPAPGALARTGRSALMPVASALFLLGLGTALRLAGRRHGILIR